MLIYLYSTTPVEAKNTLSIKKGDEKIDVFLEGVNEPIVTQNTKNGFRPYLHPIQGPGGNGVFTQYSPGHTNIRPVILGANKVNSRDYFHNPTPSIGEKISNCC